MGREAERNPAPTYAIAVVGADGPVGKSAVAANLAAAIAARGRGVTVVDCGSPERTVAQCRELIDRLDERLQPDEVAILDGPATSSDGGLMLAAAAEDVIVVAGPDAPAMRGAADAIRALATKHARRDLLLLVNRVGTFEDACDVYSTLAQIASRSARCAVHLIGWVPPEAAATGSCVKRPPADAFDREPVERIPGRASAAFESIAGKLLTERRTGRLHGGVQLFVKRLVGGEGLRDEPESMTREGRDGLVQRVDPSRDLALNPG